VLQLPQQRSVADELLLTELQQHPDLATAINLAQQFAALVRQRSPKRLDLWIEQASSSSIKQFQNFAKSLQEDYEAVKAGVTLAVSNGQAAILSMAKSCSRPGKASIVRTVESAKSARAVERTGVV